MFRTDIYNTIIDIATNLLQSQENDITDKQYTKSIPAMLGLSMLIGMIYVAHKFINNEQVRGEVPQPLTEDQINNLLKAVADSDMSQLNDFLQKATANQLRTFRIENDISTPIWGAYASFIKNSTSEERISTIDRIDRRRTCDSAVGALEGIHGLPPELAFKIGEHITHEDGRRLERVCSRARLFSVTAKTNEMQKIVVEGQTQKNSKSPQK